jgi:hypothetical protein
VDTASASFVVYKSKALLYITINDSSNRSIKVKETKRSNRLKGQENHLKKGRGGDKQSFLLQPECEKRLSEC